MIRPVVMRMVSPVIGNPFGLPKYGGVLVPPVFDALLVQLKGNDDGTDLKLDNHKKPDAENFVISKSACTSLNGADEYGLTTVQVNAGNLLDISCSFIASNTSGNNQLIYIHEGTRAYLLISDGKIAGGYGDQSAAVIIGTSTVTTDVPHKARLLVVDGIVELFLDGDLEYTGASVGAPPDGSYYYIGANYIPADELDGSIWDIRLKDDLQDHHFRCSEGIGDGTNLTSYSDDGTKTITWLGDPVTLWAGTQDIYHGDAVEGWWEISGDLVRHPYPIAGFDVYHKGGTFNDCESSYAPKGFFVGTFNGTDHILTFNPAITLSGNFVFSGYMDITTASQGFSVGGSSLMRYFSGSWDIKMSNGVTIDFTLVTNTSGVFTLTQEGTNLTLAIEDQSQTKTVPTGLSFIVQVMTSASDKIDGIVRGLGFTDASQDLKVPINEGEGTDIHDSDGNVVGTLNGDPVAFYSGAKMVAQSIIDAEAVLTTPSLTDGAGHPVPHTQDELGAINNKQDYMTDCEGNIQFIKYKKILSTAEDAEVKIFGCLGNYIVENGVQIAENGINIYEVI